MQHSEVEGFTGKKVVLSLNGERDQTMMLFNIKCLTTPGTNKTVSLIPQAMVPANRIILATGWCLYCDTGGTQLANGTSVLLRDTHSSPRTLVTLLAANVPAAGAGVGSFCGTTGTFTPGAGACLGLQQGKGLDCYFNGAWDTGALNYVRVNGVIRDDTAETYSV